MEDKTLKMTMLLDFYGELLTEKQRRCFELHYCEDMSLAEIAELQRISRQGVRDNISRAETAMESIEERTGLIARWRAERETVARLLSDAEALCRITAGEANLLAERLLNGLRKLES